MGRKKMTYVWRDLGTEVDERRCSALVVSKTPAHEGGQLPFRVANPQTRLHRGDRKGSVGVKRRAVNDKGGNTCLRGHFVPALWVVQRL